ncbi:TIGR03915 family putative DNA repair protein [Aquimarina brevivitae]|uniref:Putative DNA metabolism protein n=1 Tax=Aquimarina brevivitae TaxID=323412 RepID=A0A4Q7NZ09_9FLAO|nr:TIGR03915 family putative DNA repair protein [Aquimarina brevivitae]RZS92290.1 putative DNA metabolism protein [Aquimarina brevivitae]
MEYSDHHILNYDGTFDGFLTAIFIAYEEKLEHLTIQHSCTTTPQIFSNNQTIITHTSQANRVWKGLLNVTTPQQRAAIFKAFLSEIKGIEDLLFTFIKKLFAKEISPKDFSENTALRVAQIVKMVGREKHRMEAFVRFKLTKDHIYVATIEPDFNVLPLITSHFKDRYADQQWLIYDMKRAYGIFYDKNTTEIIALEDQEILLSNNALFASEELAFQKLWKTYYDGVNISSRKNNKLHLQHLPKRYWKYLTEKNPTL